MDFLNNINEETILIVPNILKEKVLRRMNMLNRLINVKIYSFDELKRLIYFDYETDAILYLMNKYDYKYEVAKNYIDNMYYLINDNYKNDKLVFLNNLKKELISNKLIKTDLLFTNFIKSKHAIVFGYDYVNKFNNRILSLFSSFEIIKNSDSSFKKIVYEFETLEEEIMFVLYKVISLVNDGIDLNKIKLVNVDSSYNNELVKLFDMHNIPIDIDKTSSISNTIFVKDAMRKLSEVKSFSLVVEYLKEKYDLTVDGNSLLYSRLINIFNKYVDYDFKFEKIIEAIEYDLKNTNINKNNLKNYVRISNLNNNYFDDDEYVFLLGFNQGVIPKIYKNEEYITDDMKDEVDIEKVSELNKFERTCVVSNIGAIKNIVITYKLRHKENEFYPSNLINNGCFEKVTDINDSLVSYSKDYSEIMLASMIDDFIKYGEKSDDLSVYFNTLDISYLSYDNKYSGIDSDKLKDYLNKKLVLSYSNIDTFYKCQFRYYLDNILKVNKYEETFNTFVGSLFHFVLSKIYKDNFDMDKEYDYYIKDKTFNKKEEFFLMKLKKELKIICNRLQDFNKVTGLTNVFTEKVISIDKSTDVSVIFKGIVDKIMYKNYDGKDLVAIIDYKTGNTDIDIYNAKYGIGMQLIIYLYLISKSGLFENYSFVGFYLQKILNGEVNIERGRSYLDIKNSNLKLYGYSTEDTLSLERFDETYENSEYISGMKYGKNGFYRYSKVLSDENMSSLIDLVDKKIEFARDEILNAKFDISPKKLSTDKDITGCKFCHYKDICFRKNDDVVNLEKCDDLSFLSEEGDVNA